MVSSLSVSTESDRPLVIGVGGSAGGIEALQHFFDALGDEPDAAVVVVMHLAPDETSHLAEVLQSHTAMPVVQVTEPTDLEVNRVYVTPPGCTLLIEDFTLIPHELEGTDERRAPIDRFFRSLARASVNPVGVVVSGSGTDGSVGLRAITEAGGLIAVQDPGEAAHGSMPRSAIETSRVDFVLPVAELARRLSNHRGVVHDLYVPDEPEELDDDQTATLQSIFERVRARTGNDFTEYKRSTMLRRIHRRLQVHQLGTLEAYYSYLEEHPSEATALQKDFLISVTSFFRDAEAFAALRDQVLPSLLAHKGRDDPIRAWVVGCATGEEAYSIAMLLLERVAATNLSADQIQVFATDIDEEALATAREGRYPEPIATDVPDRYLDRFFRKEGTEYAVRKPVQERVLFTPHNLLKDPPFSKLDLISCRNLLIYLRRELQESVFDIFHYALNEDGTLFLGSSESADLGDGNFRMIDKTHRLYERQNGTRKIPELPAMTQMWSAEESAVPTVDGDTGPSEAALHRRMLEAYAPPSAIVSEDYTFVHLSQTAGRYLQHPAGPPNTNILDVIRPELRVTLQTALRKAFAQGQGVHTAPVSVQFNGEMHLVRLVVRPAQEVPEAQGLALIVFVESDEELPEEEAEKKPVPEDDHVSHLETELEQTKKELRATVEEYETSKQEMRAANEELRSMNEEYKSMTEELETSKEELQSVNEELTTVNRELEEKVEELREANSDLRNLMAATDIGTLFLDRELCIQRYTPRIEHLFNIRASDTGRPIGNFTHRLDYNDLQADARAVLEDLTPVEREVPSTDDEWFLVRHHPYRTAEDRIGGVVITFVDITRRKAAENELRQANETLQERNRQVQALSEALTSAEETERERLSEILHDNLQQILYAVQKKLDLIENRVSFDDRERDLLGRAIEMLDDGIQTTRTLSAELDPPVGEESLRDSFDWLAMQMQEAYGLEVTVMAQGSVKTIDKNLRILLFRLVRELLFNVVKHAGVEAASLKIVEADDRMRVVVEDQGEGFEQSLLDERGKGGLGLVSVRERIEMIGGRFQTDTAPGEGTRVSIEVPWQGNGVGGAP
jgi:two-component system CheB/CheR fusion protein